MLKISLDLREITQLKAQLKATHKKLRDPKKLHRTMRSYQRKRWLENLYQQGGVYGGWEPLHGVTLRIRYQRGHKLGPILRETGPLLVWVKKESNNAQYSEGGGSATTQWDFAFSGSKDGSYAVLHDTGYRIKANSFTKRNRIPAGRYVHQRKVFDMNDDDKDKHLQDVTTYVEEALNAMFGP